MHIVPLLWFINFHLQVLNFEIDPSLIDVNIHPAKRELKFINEPDMYDFTYISVRKALLFKELIPTVTPGKDKRPETLAERKVEKCPEPFETNRRATELSPQPARPAQQEKPKYANATGKFRYICSTNADTICNDGKQKQLAG